MEYVCLGSWWWWWWCDDVLTVRRPADWSMSTLRLLFPTYVSQKNWRACDTRPNDQFMCGRRKCVIWFASKVWSQIGTLVGSCWHIASLALQALCERLNVSQKWENSNGNLQFLDRCHWRDAMTHEFTRIVYELIIARKLSIGFVFCGVNCGILVRCEI